jgi:glycosyltransferase involved in cell wall biosynthesis
MNGSPARPAETTGLSPCLSVVIPAYNEAATIKEIIKLVVLQPLVQEVIAVDDGSTDGTWEQLQSFAKQEQRLKLFHHASNQGKGAALRTGFAVAMAPVVVVQDADLEYDPGEYPRLVQPILDGKADVVFGSRFAGAGPHRVLYFWHYAGNRVLTTLSNMCTNINLTDMEAGYKAFRREVIQSVRLEENRFGFEPEVWRSRRWREPAASGARAHCCLQRLTRAFSNRFDRTQSRAGRWPGQWDSNTAV